MTISADFLTAIRIALLMMVDALEREMNISPRTAELRKIAKGRDKLPIENEYHL